MRQVCSSLVCPCSLHHVCLTSDYSETVSVSKEDKEKERRQMLNRIKKKYGLKVCPCYQFNSQTLKFFFFTVQTYTNRSVPEDNRCIVKSPNIHNKLSQLSCSDFLPHIKVGTRKIFHMWTLFELLLRNKTDMKYHHCLAHCISGIVAIFQRLHI